MTQPFDELDSRGPWRLCRQTAMPAAVASVVALVVYLFVVHGALATVMLVSATAALTSSLRWIHESLPPEAQDQVAALGDSGRAHLARMWASTRPSRQRAMSRLEPAFKAVDQKLDRHVGPDLQAKLATATLAAAAVVTSVALIATGTLPSSRPAVSRRGLTEALSLSVTPLGPAPSPTTAAKGPVAVAASSTPIATTRKKASAAQPPALHGALPVGKGMWIWLPQRAENGDPKAIVARAKTIGLTHLYVKVGSSVDGFINQDFLNGLLPVAHAAGIRVYGWDFPYLDDWQVDAARGAAEANFTAPGGHRLDGLSADIELQSMGVRITHASALAYGWGLRKALGNNYPLIATVPRPSSQLVGYPFAELANSFDALAPMVYWLNREPGADAAGAVADLSVYGKPVLPIGQAYDGAAEGGRPGVPPRAELIRFMQVAEQSNAVSVSFWSWQHADQQAWDAIRDAGEFTLPAAPAALSPAQVHAYQVLLNSLGFPVKPTEQLDQQTSTAIAAYQQRARLPVTGVIDAATRAMLLTPFAPPIQPQG